MTRINVVPPSELTRQHLIAELRELPRVFSLARKATEQYHGKLAWSRAKKPPESYVLGTGHVNFFVPRLSFLVERYKALCAEWRSRGYNIQAVDTKDLCANISHSFFGDYTVTPEALACNRERIALRLSESKEKR